MTETIENVVTVTEEASESTVTQTVTVDFDDGAVSGSHLSPSIPLVYLC